MEKPTSLSPNDDFRAANPRFIQFVQEVEKEFDYQMSDRQCSWAVISLLNNDMSRYNAENGTSLSPRP